MTTITINIPDNLTTRVVNGFCKFHAYSPILENGSPNPETKAQFAKRKLLEYIKQAVREAEIQDATNVAATSAAASVDSQVNLS